METAYCSSDEPTAPTKMEGAVASRTPGELVDLPKFESSWVLIGHGLAVCRERDFLQPHDCLALGSSLPLRIETRGTWPLFLRPGGQPLSRHDGRLDSPLNESQLLLVGLGL